MKFDFIGMVYVLNMSKKASNIIGAKKLRKNIIHEALRNQVIVEF